MDSNRVTMTFQVDLPGIRKRDNELILVEDFVSISDEETFFNALRVARRSIKDFDKYIDLLIERKQTLELTMKELDELPFVGGADQ